MKVNKQLFRHLTTVILVFWMFICIFATFLGAGRARVMFNSYPFLLFWIVLLISLIFGIFQNKSLYRKPQLLLIHLGLIFIIFAGMYDSAYLNSLRSNLRADRFQQAYIILNKGESSNMVFDYFNDRVISMPFSIKLKDFEIEYYDDLNLTDNVKDYVSSIEIIEDGAKVGEALVRINHPFRYKNYSIYQKGYDTEDGQYSIFIISYVSARKLLFIGFGMLLVGVFWQMWFVSFLKSMRGYKNAF